MSASKAERSDPFRPVTVSSPGTRLHLTADHVRIRKNGIEFRSEVELPMWAEMTVSLETPFETRTFEANGVVVACQGNRHAGYLVSLIFTGLTLPDKARLQLLAFSSLA